MGAFLFEDYRNDQERDCRGEMCLCFSLGVGGIENSRYLWQCYLLLDLLIGGLLWRNSIGKEKNRNMGTTNT